MEAMNTHLIALKVLLLTLKVLLALPSPEISILPIQSLIAFDATSVSDGIILFKFCPVIIASMPNRDHRGKRVCG